VSDAVHTAPEAQEPRAAGRGDRIARRLLIPLGLLFFVLVMLTQILFSTTAVRGDSMEPTLRSGDRLLVTKSYSLPARGDVVIFDTVGEGEEEEGLIKRVVAVEGDSVEIRRGIALVNDVTEPLDHVRTSEMDSTYREPMTVPKGHVYVLGDHRLVALDSRDLGPIPMESVRARVVYIFAPITRVRRIR
jgi:signal peptidase I